MCPTVTTGRPATMPAKSTTPSPAARTRAPGVPARSTPRWPGNHGRGGGSNGRTTRAGPSTGHRKTSSGTGRDDGTTAGRPESVSPRERSASTRAGSAAPAGPTGASSTGGTTATASATAHAKVAASANAKVTCGVANVAAGPPFHDRVVSGRTRSIATGRSVPGRTARRHPHGLDCGQRKVLWTTTHPTR